MWFAVRLPLIVLLLLCFICRISCLARVDNWSQRRPNATVPNWQQRPTVATTRNPSHGWNAPNYGNQQYAGGRYNQTSGSHNWQHNNNTQGFPPRAGWAPGSTPQPQSPPNSWTRNNQTQYYPHSPNSNSNWGVRPNGTSYNAITTPSTRNFGSGNWNSSGNNWNSGQRGYNSGGNNWGSDPARWNTSGNNWNSGQGGSNSGGNNWNAGQNWKNPQQHPQSPGNWGSNPQNNNGNAAWNSPTPPPQQQNPAIGSGWAQPQSNPGSPPLAPIGENNPWNAGNAQSNPGSSASGTPLAPLAGANPAWNYNQAGLSYGGGAQNPDPNQQRPNPNAHPYANLLN